MADSRSTSIYCLLNKPESYGSTFDPDNLRTGCCKSIRFVLEENIQQANRMNLQTEVGKLKRVGPKTAELLNSKGLYTAGDLVNYFPYRYEKYVSLSAVSAAEEGRECAVLLTVIGKGSSVRAGGRTICHFKAGDATGDCRITFFNMPYMVKNLPPGSQRVFMGVMKKSPRGLRYMEQPRVYAVDDYHSLEGSLQPVYPLFQGIKNRQICALVDQVLEGLPEFEDYLDSSDRERLGLCTRDQALRAVHHPTSIEELGKARNRLIFDEFFEFILGIRKKKKENDVLRSEDPMQPRELPDELISKLPYALTGAQKRSWEEIKRDLTGEFVMSRLLQGDVGSGKTILAFLALLLCSANHRQGALMAPTEVLARQHMENLTKLKEQYELPIRPVLLTGSVKGKARKDVYEKIASGEADIIIGTHALIQDSVEYANLGLVVTDEQHRFGVRQRESLAGKGNTVPVLVMSATPIPRTLAIIMYGDLQISVLDEMPSGRLPIKNLAISSTERRRIYRFMYGQIKQGRQAYVICPEVEEGVMSDLENVQDYTEKLRKIFPPEVRIDSLNGRMKPAEKTEIMERFSAGQTDILVSTTVIEVGIDVPNASVIAIENAERFGMSQLHQLRGRVGRGKWQSYCIFLYTEGAEGEGSGAGKPKRLEILEKTNDGFVIAEEDLKLRGPGDLFGERQSGELGFVLADIYEDSAIMRKAAAYVDEVLASDPDFKMPHLRQLDFRTI